MSEWVATKERLPEKSGIYFVVEKRCESVNYVDHVHIYCRDEVTPAYFFEYADAWECIARVPTECSPDYWLDIVFIPEVK